MNTLEAKEVFASLMQVARKRQLTPREKSELSAARQTLRRAKRPATGNPARGFQAYAETSEGYQVSPIYDRKDKAQRWLRDLRTIFARTGKKVTAGGVKQHKAGRNPRARAANPGNNGVKIYGRILRIEAQKTQKHICDAACKRANHCYFHDFTTKNAQIYGMPDGSLRIRVR